MKSVNKTRKQFYKNTESTQGTFSKSVNDSVIESFHRFDRLSNVSQENQQLSWNVRNSSIWDKKKPKVKAGYSVQWERKKGWFNCYPSALKWAKVTWNFASVNGKISLKYPKRPIVQKKRIWKAIIWNCKHL